MGRWTAPSDRDYFDEANGPYDRGIARTCADCGRTVYVSRQEPYTLTVVCDRCQSRAALRVPQGATK